MKKTATWQREGIIKQTIKILLFISLILFVAIGLTGCKDEADSQRFEFNSSTGSIEGTKAKEVSDLVIPSQIDGTDVREIGVRAFRNANITSVEIPNGVEVIGEDAFRINNLTSVGLPDSVKEIRKGAFADNDLRSVEIPDSVEVLGFASFAYNSLTSVELPENLEKLEGYTFADNDLTSVDIPDNLEVIELYTFKGNSLTSLKIPDSVKAIKYSAFVGNNLTSVELPAGVDLPPVRRKAFDGNLKEVYDENNKEEGVYVRDDLNSDWYKQE